MTSRPWPLPSAGGASLTMEAAAKGCDHSIPRVLQPVGNSRDTAHQVPWRPPAVKRHNRLLEEIND